MEAKISEVAGGMARRAQVLTKSGIEEGTIPSICPVCKNPTDRLVIHHWWGERRYVIEDGDYRRICPSCNAILGVIYKGNYPIRWEEQFAALGKYFEKFPGFYSNFDGVEGDWSLLTETEVELIKGRGNYSVSEDLEDYTGTLEDYTVVVRKTIEKGIYKFPKTKHTHALFGKLDIKVFRGDGIRGPKPRS